MVFDVTGVLIMGIINWDKPKKIRGSKEHVDTHRSDSGIPGTFVPNMSDGDVKKWKGKIVGITTGSPQVEIRKNSMLIIVSLGAGYQYKFYTREKTIGINLHISMAGPTQLSFDEWGEMKAVVEEARQELLSIAKSEEDPEER